MTVYGYARVSTQDQVENASLPDQERRIKGKAMGAGLPDPVIFRDEGVSGSIPLYERPNGAVMVKLLQPGDTIITAKLDRMFRSASDALHVVEQFKKNKVDLIIADMGDDPVTRDGAAKFFFSIMAAAAEFERSRILERTNEGRKAKRSAGGFIGGHTPYGYTVVGEGRDAALQPIDSEQTLISLARQMRADGLSLRAIAGNLAVLGHVNRHGHPLHANQVARLTA